MNVRTTTNAAKRKLKTFENSVGRKTCGLDVVAGRRRRKYDEEVPERIFGPVEKVNHSEVTLFEGAPREVS